MTKISSLPSDSAPTTTDSIPTLDAETLTTKRVTLASLITLFFNNIPNNTVKSPALALSNALDSTNGVKSQTNTGSAGGTIYYINLGGIKLAWGITGTITVNSTVVSSNITFPTSFFTAVNTVVAVINHAATDDRQAVHADTISATGTTLVNWNTAGVNTGSATVGYLAIGN